ncbi:EFR1 family ferrodoxin [Promethearchaeum syntrophicum]|uniref:EFR1 family ferrodoxin n=1 Tax=Promethearchaeum syntrophicum TaxID=2594042 RepID=A0A5B9D7Z3_9ARCH|nr:EFR1 family ferrodoxin [Candidatus Prometheoarchaeum syntrophicum]QEE15173.1 flavodoxin [Candidatus Prometheoarchaeum syntrophicum]
MKICIFYFSGTGNTEIIAHLLQKELINLDAEVIEKKIENMIKKKTMVNTEKYDLIGIGYPIHAFNAPKIVYTFIQQLHNDKGKKLFTFRSSGDPFLHGGSTKLLRNQLEKKGFNVFNENLSIMPTNVLLKFNDNLNKQLYQLAQIRIKKLAQDIMKRKVSLERNNFILTLVSKIFSFMETTGAKWLGKRIIISDSCIKCFKCVRNCPTGNILLFGEAKDTIKFNCTCNLCMRCIYECPTNAIHFKYFRFFEIKQGYNINTILYNPNIKGNYLSSNTKGFFKHYADYFGL